MAARLAPRHTFLTVLPRGLAQVHVCGHHGHLQSLTRRAWAPAVGDCDTAPLWATLTQPSHTDALCVPPAGPEMGGGGGRGPGGQPGMMGGRGRGRGPPQYLPQGMMGPPPHPYAAGPPPQQSPPAEPTGLQVGQGGSWAFGQGAVWEPRPVGVATCGRGHRLHQAGVQSAVCVCGGHSCFTRSLVA